MSEPVFDPSAPTELDADQMIAVFFDVEWDALSAAGICDGRGGAEYSRISQLWAREGAPLQNLDLYICIEVNCLLCRSREEKI